MRDKLQVKILRVVVPQQRVELFDVVPADQELSELAGQLKVAKKMSLADCFAAALAKREKLEVFTGDPEFKAMGREIKVVWL